MKKIVFVITGLNTGGAETMFCNLLQQINKNEFDLYVISLLGEGILGVKLKSLGIPVFSLKMRRGFLFNPSSIILLKKLLNEIKPDLIQTWMHHANLLGGLVAKLSNRKIPVVFGIHSTKWCWIALVVSPLSRFLSVKNLFCSNSAYNFHIRLGFVPSQSEIISNGFNSNKFAPNEHFRREIRVELQISERAIVIGWVGRFHRDKDPDNFIQACIKACSENEKLICIMCGDGIELTNREINRSMEMQKYGERFKLLGRRDDIQKVINSFDILCLSSKTEAFPIVLGEAMSACVPCIATDVGDNAIILGNSGVIVPPKNPGALASAIIALAAKPKGILIQLGKQARERILKNYSLDIIARQYESIYNKLIGK